MNMICITGRLTKLPELRTSANGNTVVNFTVAVDFVKNGEKTADFFDCVAFGKTAENISKYFQKGDGIGVTGEIHQDRFKDKNGNDRVKWVLNVRNFDFFTTKKQDIQPQASDYSDIAEDDDFPF